MATNDELRSAYEQQQAQIARNAKLREEAQAAHAERMAQLDRLAAEAAARRAAEGA